MTPYTYTILRYLPDPSAGEMVNVGLLLYAPEAQYVCFLRQTRFAHFSKFFADFKRDDCTRFLGWLESAVKRFKQSITPDNPLQPHLIKPENLPADAGILARKLVPDQGLNFQFGAPGAGLARDLDATAQKLFHRFVISRQNMGDKSHKRRDDNDVWVEHKDIFNQFSITKVLEQHVVKTDSFEVPFNHAFKNDNWHAIQPLSFDYAEAQSIRELAARWMGYGVALDETPDFAKLYLLLGKPGLEAHREDYNRAKDYLHKMPIKPELIEEDEVEDFAQYLASYMREHGILQEAATFPEAEE